MEKERLLELINQERKKLHEAIDEKGLDHRKTLTYSRELDKLISKYIKLSSSINQ
ncbi:aspartyl-phosphate phosphatase Spo0E family protein [Salirhabdus sp. Marseille-P4669]|uniref:aspartyl-phosphate phosphatase Spo0E family protein n=1 Tax=Salirhabdus sp. Marseille-P4669 TaxID=2042310 RepID=UPI001358A3C2|nr:aspartyl-phosphate phosphatase Spo0E family protein [Salirhabdus sp. Marseille-P4669]